MKRSIYILLIPMFIFLSPHLTEAQKTNDCKVLTAEISQKYEGECKIGLAQGIGKASGYWRNGNYIGTENLLPYRVSANRNMQRYQIRRTGDGSEVKMYFLRQGSRNAIINNLAIEVNSGSVNIFSSDALVNVNSFPVTCRISYQTLDNGGVATLDVVLEFVINDPGVWNVTLSH